MIGYCGGLDLHDLCVHEILTFEGTFCLENTNTMVGLTGHNTAPLLADRGKRIGVR